jgi:integrase
LAARPGQHGTIEKKGKWWRVRFRVDVPGEHKQKQVAVRICPIEGPGALSKTERSRRALVLMAEHGVNSDKAFREWEAGTLGTTFREQSERWLLQVQTRKRKPVKARTISNWRSHLEWINQRIGDIPVRDVNNKVARDLIAAMAVERSRRGGQFSAKTQHNYLQVVKRVVASVVNEQGDAVFPRTWNHDFIDLPIVGPQRQPSLTAAEIADLIRASEAQYRVLFALLAGSGLRIGEALALEVADLKDNTISVTKSLWESNIGTPKTAAGCREVDLADNLVELLCAHIGRRVSGFIFQTTAGTPLSQRNVLGRQLHPALKAIGREVFGFHAFRRFRVTHLRKQRVPEDLIRFWMGHANKTVTDEYCKLRDDVDYRHQVAQAAGIGFPMPDPAFVTGCDPISHETVAVIT